MPERKFRAKKTKPFSRKQRLEYHTTQHNKDAFANGYGDSPTHKIAASLKQQKLEQIAKETGKTLTQVIVESWETDNAVANERR